VVGSRGYKGAAVNGALYADGNGKRFRQLDTLYIVENEIVVQAHWRAMPNMDAWLVPDEEYRKLIGWVN
jgi:hypothetical protein